MSKLNDRRSPAHNLEKIVDGFGAAYYKADGNDFLDVYQKTKMAINNIKNNNQPCVLECITYRHMAHSAPICDDKAGYRDIDVPDVRAKEDSVKRLRVELLKTYEETEIIKVEEDVNSTILSAFEFALNSPYPAHEDLNTEVYHA